MGWLIIGLSLWTGAHLFKRLLPRQREALDKTMGKAARALVAVVILASVALMVVGYRQTDYVHLYSLPNWLWYVNNLAMLVAIFLMDIGRSGGITASKIRHPMLCGVLIWSVSHLLVNGDVAAVVLFGGLGLWALLEIAVINRSEGPWSAPAPGPITQDIKYAVLALVIYAVIVGIHYWLGYPVIAPLR